MRCYPEALETLLKKKLAPLYVLHGPETFLIEESAIQIRKAHSKEEREHLLFTIEPHNPGLWEALLHQMQHFSLFSPSQLIEIRLAKITVVEAQNLIKILANQSEETVLFIQTGLLSRSQQQAKWFTLAEQKGVVIPHWPLSGQAFEKWIRLQLQKHGLSLSKEALRLFIDCTEGNPLAAKQEIDRLCLYHADRPEDAIITQLEKQSQFEVFDLCEAALQREPARVVKILDGLKSSQSAAPQLILWSFTQTLRVLLHCHLATSEEAKQAFLRQAGIRVTAHSLYLKTYQRFSKDFLSSLLTKLASVDKQLKSGEIQAVWQAFLEISLHLSGLKIFKTDYNLPSLGI